MEEFWEHGSVLAAVTLGELSGFVLLSLLLWSVWLLTGAHHVPWPILPTLFVGLKALDTVSGQLGAAEQGSEDREDGA